MNRDDEYDYLFKGKFAITLAYIAKRKMGVRILNL